MQVSMIHWFKAIACFMVLAGACNTEPALSQTSNDTVLFNGNRIPFLYLTTYPNKAEDAGIEGVVKVEFTVDTLCQISKRRVVQSIGYGCDEAALQAINRRFEELLMKENHFQCHTGQMTIPFIFKLRD